jgi:hypothetical protein
MYIFFKMDVLLFSKFSMSSTNLLKQINEIPELLESISIICIDNKKVREQILNDQKIKIKNVPCLIRINNNTENYDIYEGQNVFDFFKNITHKINQEKEILLKQQKLKEEEEKLEKLKSKIELEFKNKKTKKVTPIEELGDNDSGIKTYTHIPKNEENTERELNEKKAKTTVKSDGNLLSMAMKLQKERENN